jgi:hypothetical protein
VSPLITRLIGLAGTVVLLGAVQRLFANKRVSEQHIEDMIAATTPESWNFVAMEYCYGMLNRTYLVFVTPTMICGSRVRGLISAPMAITARHYNPYFYARPSAVAKYSHMNIESADFLKLSRANFQIARRDLERCEFTKQPKWGMGTLPYSGRLILHLRNDSTRELILLGSQDGPNLQVRLA